MQKLSGISINVATFIGAVTIGLFVSIAYVFGGN